MSRSHYFESSNSDVLLKVREWEGVGHAEHAIVDRITTVYAKGLLTELAQAITKAENYQKEKDLNREKQLEKEIEQKQAELALLRNKREKLSPPPDDDYTPI